MFTIYVYMIIMQGASVSVTPNVRQNVCEVAQQQIELDWQRTYKSRVFCIPMEINR
jgi:hypothetical protein